MLLTLKMLNVQINISCTWTESFLTFFMAPEDELRRETNTTVLLVYSLVYDENRGIHSLCSQEEFSVENIRLVMQVHSFFLAAFTS